MNQYCRIIIINKYPDIIQISLVLPHVLLFQDPIQDITLCLVVMYP